MSKQTRRAAVQPPPPHRMRSAGGRIAIGATMPLHVRRAASSGGSSGGGARSRGGAPIATAGLASSAAATSASSSSSSSTRWLDRRHMSALDAFQLSIDEAAKEREEEEAAAVAEAAEAAREESEAEPQEEEEEEGEASEEERKASGRGRAGRRGAAAATVAIHAASASASASSRPQHQGKARSPTATRARPASRRARSDGSVGESHHERIDPRHLQLVELDQAAIARGLHTLATAFADCRVTWAHLQAHPLLVATAPDGRRLVNWKSVMLCCAIKEKEFGQMKRKWRTSRDAWKRSVQMRQCNALKLREASRR